MSKLNHLLLAGQIIDRGQLSVKNRRELDRRAKAGRLVKGTKTIAGKEYPCWFTLGVKSLAST